MTRATGLGEWSGALAGYSTAQRAAGRTAGTIRLHSYYLEHLAGVLPSPWRCSTRTLEAFLSVPHWAPETRKSARGAVRGFYRWGHGHGLIDHDPGRLLAPVRVPPGLPRPTPEHVVRQLLHQGDPRIDFMGRLAAYGGLRRGEIARVHGGDLEGDELVVHGKGGRVRSVPIVDPRLFAHLERARGDWAFPNGLGSHLSPGHVGRLLAAALPGDWTAHTLRHRLATQAYRGTRDLLAVQQLLGHSRPETTQRYVLLPDDALRAAVAAAC